MPPPKVAILKKLISVQYYLVEYKTQEEVCKIFC